MATLSLVPVTATDDTFAEWEAVFDVTDPDAEEETIDTVYGVFSSGLENLDDMLMEDFDTDDECGCDDCGNCSCCDE